MKDQQRNLNPTRAARLAMLVWGNEYAVSGAGSMDFYDSLSQTMKDDLIRWVELLDLSPCEENEDAKVLRLLVAGGFITEQKIQQARDLLFHEG